VKAPSDVVEAFAHERPLFAVHEAGHAVAQVVGGLPLHDVRIGYWRSWTGRCWRLEGRARPTRRGGFKVRGTAAIRAALVASMAGPEAEARWLDRTTGTTLAAARAQAMRDSRDGDGRQIARLFPDSEWARAEFDQNVQELVERHWPLITQLADQLLRHSCLTGDAVRTLVSCGGLRRPAASPFQPLTPQHS
jgi:hypothetical protein